MKNSIEFIELELQRIISDASDYIPAYQKDNMISMVRSGESCVALENLCTQLFEYDIKVDGETLSLLRSFCRYFKVDDSYLEGLA
jgi:hypothetical protein